jgi:hypothetical protein
MSDTIKLERGKTVMYPNMYPKLLITPVFGRRNDFVWVEEIRCCWDAESSGKGNEFAFVRAAAHYEQVDQLEAENAKLRELLQRTWDAFHDATAREFVSVKNELRELGVEVD